MVDEPSNAEIEHYRKLSSFVPEFAWHSIVPLLDRRGSRLVQFGTGTLFTVGQESFIVTAAHVVRQASGSLFASAPDGTFVQLAGKWICSVGNQHGSAQDPFDVAIFRLDQSLRTRFGGGTVFTSARDPI